MQPAEPGRRLPGVDRPPARGRGGNSMTPSLFEGRLVRFMPPDPERDAEIESAWTHDAEYLRLIEAGPARPLSPTAVKKKYEALEKAENKEFYFAVRLLAD